MSLWQRLVGWWHGESDDVDPETLAEAKRIREDVETRRTGDFSGQTNISHRGGLSSGRGDFE
jgi:hypothetical protein